MSIQDADYYEGPARPNAYEPRRAPQAAAQRRDNYAPSGPRQDPLTKHYTKMFTLPFLFILIAIVTMTASTYPDAPDEEDYNDDHEKWQKAVEDFNDQVEDVQSTANLLFSIGVLMLSFLLFMGPFVDRGFTTATKIVMMVLGVAIIALFLTEGFKLNAVFGG
jgi:magnesium-transporting ATPase (P-type)